jgi:drug/metabolite transporter (DMT)-like permease
MIWKPDTPHLGVSWMVTSLIVVAVLFWASAFVGIRAALLDYSPIEIAVLRFAISSLALFPIAISRKTRLPRREDFLHFALLGLVVFINHIALNYGTRTITAGETTLIVSTSQLFQVLLAYLFLKETILNRFLLGLSVCFLGVTIIALQNSAGMSLNLGVVFVLLAAITNAIFFILQKPLLRRYRPLEVISYSTWIATLLFLPFGSGAVDAVSGAKTSSTAAVVYIGIAAVVANTCWSKVLSRIEASKAAVFLYTIPVTAIVIGFLWLRELPTPISCLGGAIILGGVLLSNAKTAGPGHAQ